MNWGPGEPLIHIWIEPPKPVFWAGWKFVFCRMSSGGHFWIEPPPLTPVFLPNQRRICGMSSQGGTWIETPRPRILAGWKGVFRCMSSGGALMNWTLPSYFCRMKVRILRMSSGGNFWIGPPPLPTRILAGWNLKACFAVCPPGEALNFIRRIVPCVLQVYIYKIAHIYIYGMCIWYSIVLPDYNTSENIFNVYRY